MSDSLSKLLEELRELDKEEYESDSETEITGKEAKDKSILNEPQQASSTSHLNEPSTSAVKRKIVSSDDEDIKPVRPKKKKKFPEQNASDKAAFLEAAQEGNLKVLEEYLIKGMPIDVTNIICQTPLMIAAVAGQEQTCRFLISRGANYKLADELEQTVFDTLKKQKSMSLLEKLTNFINEMDKESPEVNEIQKNAFCAVCQRRYSGSSSNHLASELHSYHEENKDILSRLIISTKIGFNPLLRLKLDFGSEKSKNEVTDFNTNDDRAVQSEERTKAARGRSKRKVKKSKGCVLM